MANPLYESLMGGRNAPKPNSTQGNPMNMQDAMNRLQSNPAMMTRQAGFSIPDEIGNNPQSIVTYLIQSGQVSNPLLNKIRPMLSQLMG